MPSADSGKDLEERLTKYLQERGRNKWFWWHRFPDARTSMGRIGKQPADYICVDHGRAYLLDPKELKSDTRINIASRLTQLPKMERFILAGNSAFFLIHYLVDNTYRVLNAKYALYVRDSGDKSIPIHDMLPIRSIEIAMQLVEKQLPERVRA